MLRHSHALSGGVTGVGWGLVFGWSLPQTLTLGALTAGMALLPDLDQCGSGPARSLGFLSEAVAFTIGKLAGGHRHVTHSFLGIALFAGFAYLAGVFRGDIFGKVGLALLVALTVAGGLEALHLARSHVADAAAMVAAWFVVWHAYHPVLALIPLAVALGCATHIAGDLCTDSGCMLGCPFSMRRYHLLPEPLAFTTGTAPELLIVDPVLTAALAFLLAQAVAPGLVLSLLHQLKGIQL